MTKITFTNTIAALNYAAELEKIGFSPVITPYMVRGKRFCRNGKEVYINIENK